MPISPFPYPIHLSFDQNNAIQEDIALLHLIGNDTFRRFLASRNQTLSSRIVASPDRLYSLNGQTLVHENVSTRVVDFQSELNWSPQPARFDRPHVPTEEELQKVRELMDIGFAEEECFRALQDCGWDINSAANYLLSRSLH
jgi:hypothetical protein